MQTKLTLRIDELLIERAKSYAKKHGKSVSQIVSGYFLLLNRSGESQSAISILPITQSLRGVLKNNSFSESDYKHHLEKKYL
jgi:hypothetical protein